MFILHLNHIPVFKFYQQAAHKQLIIFLIWICEFPLFSSLVDVYLFLYTT